MLSLVVTVEEEAGGKKGIGFSGFLATGEEDFYFYF